MTTLKDLLCQKSLQIGEFTLVSGEKSTFYVDSKLTTYSPEAMPLIGRAFLSKMAERGWAPDAAGGLALGADPIAFALARESPGSEPPIDAFVVRNATK